MTTEMCCHNCRFFSPGEGGCPSYETETELGEYDETKEGQCRRHPPGHGKTIPQKNGELMTYFGDWPKVMACFWCGEFQQRTESESMPALCR